jgi:hypothetical protein
MRVSDWQYSQYEWTVVRMSWQRKRRRISIHWKRSHRRSGDALWRVKQQLEIHGGWETLGQDCETFSQ